MASTSCLISSNISIFTRSFPTSSTLTSTNLISVTTYIIIIVIIVIIIIIIIIIIIDLYSGRNFRGAGGG